MSCGKPHDVDCAEVLERVFLFLDNELDEADCAKIRRHLDECAPCLQKYDLEELVKSLVARSCGGDKPPESLRSKILARIRAVHVQITESSPPAV
ncbi:mycothiol system anti-sigma-R factor [Thermasporomyces composti]|jgi:mycothiol system anti-sigma-R factor|uniref:Mycothiol system anti-sigma-R factor n=1 Tax=Thermasporomyces composti TaxID=696763 RepID=A0A3D9V904_THECX|nr:mycothiol system anti-sigma-R factor [Thermasporomyces composti]REF35475.1 mycothiol system anti-sigma-R factor [Thermasporomyces composti]